MGSKTKLKLVGRVEITLKRKGKIVKKLKIKNLITNAGLDTLAKAILSAAGSGVSLGDAYIAVGDNVGLPVPPAPSITDTALANELPDLSTPRKKVLPGGLTLQNNVAIFEVEFLTDEGNPTLGFDLVDAGLFWDGASITRNTGVLVSRVLIIPPLAKDPVSDALGVRWTYQFQRE